MSVIAKSSTRSQFNRVELADRMTADEFFELAPADQKAELIDGLFQTMPPPSDEHEQLHGFLFSLLRLFAEDNNLGEVRGSRSAVRIDAINAYEPDILFVSRERDHIIQSKGIFGAPEFVVEILSASTAHYDRHEKLRAYERAGVQEYWIIDPYGPSGSAFYQRVDDRFELVSEDEDGWLHATAIDKFKIKRE